MNSDLLWTLIAIQMAMGAFDMLYHHEFTERLAWRASQRRELQLHGLRNLLYALQWWVFGAFALFVWWRHLADTLALESAAAEAAAEPVPAAASGAPPTK